MACPTFDGLELENGELTFNGPDRAQKETHPPGFEGTLKMDMGFTKRSMSVTGIMTSADESAISKMFTRLDSKVKKEPKDLVAPGLMSFAKVQLLDVSWNRIFFDVATAGTAVEYTATFEQLFDEKSF